MYSRPEEGYNPNTYTIVVKPELYRCYTYFFFWTMCIAAAGITKVFVAPRLEGGAAYFGDVAPERMGCGPFNRNNSPVFDLKYGEGFTLDQSHLTEAFGYNNICSLWDYTPAREIIAMYFPFFEYSLVIYLGLDYVSTMMSYRRGLLPDWYWKATKIVTPICILLCINFRMIFVCIAYEQTRGHTAAFLGLQVALIIVAIMNVAYVLLTQQSYPSLKMSKERTAKLAILYLILNLSISLVKIGATIYIVTSADVVSPPFYKYPLSKPFSGMVLGRIVDLIWMIFNGVIPAYIAYVRMKNETPLTIDISVPVPRFERPEEAEVETVGLVIPDK